MNTESFIADSYGGKPYSSAAQRWEEQQRLVGMVVTAYLAAKSLPTIVATNPDQSSRSRSNRWNPDIAHYIADVEICTRRVIESKPESERPALWATWSNLLTDLGEITKEKARLIKLLAGPYYTRRLHPGIYFAPNVNRYGAKGK